MDNIENIADQLYELNRHIENFILIFTAVMGKPLNEYSIDSWEFEK